MKIQELVRGNWTVYAACDSRGNCTLVDWLNSIDKSQRRYSDGMLALLDRVAKHRDGPGHLSVEIRHKIRGEIHQLTYGRLRVLYFYGDGPSIICTHGFKKKTGTTPKKQIRKAERTFAEYREALEQGRIELEGVEDGD